MKFWKRSFSKFEEPKLQQHWSRYANKLRCPYCNKIHSLNDWPINGDYNPIYLQTEPRNYALFVTCQNCEKEWYVVWDNNPGPLMPLNQNVNFYRDLLQINPTKIYPSLSISYGKTGYINLKDIIKYVKQLDEIYQKHKTFLERGKEDSREVGNKINIDFGINGMIYVADFIHFKYGGIMGELEFAWNEIGEWMA